MSDIFLHGHFLLICPHTATTTNATNARLKNAPRAVSSTSIRQYPHHMQSRSVDIPVMAMPWASDPSSRGSCDGEAAQHSAGTRVSDGLQSRPSCADGYFVL